MASVFDLVLDLIACYRLVTRVAILPYAVASGNAFRVDHGQCALVDQAMDARTKLGIS